MYHTLYNQSYILICDPNGLKFGLWNFIKKVHCIFALEMVTWNMFILQMISDRARQNLHDLSFPLGTVGEWSPPSCWLICDRLATTVKTSNHPVKLSIDYQPSENNCWRVKTFVTLGLVVSRFKKQILKPADNQSASMHAWTNCTATSYTLEQLTYNHLYLLVGKCFYLQCDWGIKPGITKWKT